MIRSGATFRLLWQSFIIILKKNIIWSLYQFSSFMLSGKINYFKIMGLLPPPPSSITVILSFKWNIGKEKKRIKKYPRFWVICRVRTPWLILFVRINVEWGGLVVTPIWKLKIHSFILICSLTNFRYFPLIFWLN